MDFYVLNLIQSIRTPFLDAAMPYITYLGSGAAVWIVLCIIFLIKKSDKITGIKIAVSLLLGTVIFVLGMKNLVARERPFNCAEGLFNSLTLLIPPPSDRYSFPSGHALTSFAAAYSVFMHKKRLGSICIAAAAVIAFSMLYLYVHFPSDVIFGAIFGIICALASNKIVDKVMKV